MTQTPHEPRRTQDAADPTAPAGAATGSGEWLLTGADVLGRGTRDIAVRDGVIVDPATLSPDARRVDCTGLVALPGLVDPHTHLREPGPGDAETIETGTRAAARGGYTAVFSMANTTPTADTPAVVEQIAESARRAGTCDVYPVGSVTKGLRGEELSDIAGMHASAANVRMFSDDGVCVARSDLMRDALTQIGEFGGVLAQHSQDPLLTVGAQLNDGVVSRDLGLPGWPAMAEETIIARDCIMAHHLGARVHVCHLSTRGAVEVVRWAKSQGHPVTAEVTPHHLLLVDEDARGGDTNFKVNPPLRTADDVAAVRDALVDGTIDVVGTDHAPHAPGAKAKTWCDAPMGMLGLETSLAIVASTLVETGRLTWADVAERMSDAPARMIGITDEHGGDLSVGRPANICLIDPDRPWTVDPDALASLSRNTPYAGMDLRARVVATLLRGTVTHDLDGRLA